MSGQKIATENLPAADMEAVGMEMEYTWQTVQEGEIMKIVLLEDLGVSPERIEQEAQKLKTMGHELQTFSRSEDLDTLQKETQDADAIILANMPLPAQVIENDPNLKYIDVAFTGVDHIPVALAKEKGIAISNASGYANDAVAELALAMMIDRVRKLEELEARARDSKTKAGIRGRLLKGKTVGIVGAGEIGTAVARLCQAFGCRVIGYKRHEITDPAYDEQADLDTLLAQSDIVSLHVPLTESTRHMIDARKLALMKPSAILVNTARGPVVDQQALLEALQEGRLAGAALDVFDQEPPLDPGDKLLSTPNLTLTPHVGFDSQESMEKRADIVFDNLYSWLDGQVKNQIC